MASNTRTMSFGSFLVLLFVVDLFDVAIGDVTKRTNERCDKICQEESARVAQSHQWDCSRGCRYFNIEFLTIAGKENDKLELQGVLDVCHSLCSEAYPFDDGLRRDACHLGCKRMFEVQSKAPVALGGWIVYMGASDRSMVVMQPPELLENSAQGDNEWVLLDSIFRPSHDYNEIPSASGDTTYKLTETKIQTMPIYTSSDRERFGNYRRRTHSQFCIPAWMWLIPVTLLMALVYIQYGTTIRNVLVIEDESDDELEQEIIIERRKSSDGGNESCRVSLKQGHKDTFVALAPFFLPDKDGRFPEEKLLLDLPPKYEEQYEKPSKVQSVKEK